MTNLYAHFNANEDDWPNIFYRDRTVLADPDLAALIQKERKIADNEVGAFDANPLCDCQDWDHMQVDQIELSDRSSNAVTAKVKLSLGPNMAETILVYRLVRIKGKWLIHDIFSEQDHTGMRERLESFIFSIQ